VDEAVVDEAVRMMAEKKQSRTDWHRYRPQLHEKGTSTKAGIYEMDVLVCLGLLVAWAVVWKLSINRAATSIKNL